jgi:RNA polymerase sigma-70 factor (ECF subfamily)
MMDDKRHSAEVDMVESTQKIHDFIQDNAASLRRTLRLFVAYAGLAQGEAVPDVADEVLQDTVVEALKSAGNFDPTRQPQPMGWLLGIASNVIKRHRAKEARRHTHEVAVQDTVPSSGQDVGSSERRSDSDLFDRIASLSVECVVIPIHFKHRMIALAQDDVAQNFDAGEAVEALLARCSPEDRRVLRLAVLEGLDGRAVAKELGIEPPAARVRLHRALKRLQKILEQQG